MTEQLSTTRILNDIYPPAVAAEIAPRLQAIIESYRGRIPPPAQTGLTSADAFLITYPDQLSHPGKMPLSVLGEFCRKHLGHVISTIHLLPFYPYSSDDGFSVIDFRQVNPAFGGWQDVNSLSGDFRMMFDAVINHVSQKSAWFEAFLKDDPRRAETFIVIKGNPDLSRVVRPRTLPLLTAYQTASGEKKVWTTFSADQVDLNYRNPEVLLEIMDTLLFYAAQGASFLRLDAIAYLWKEAGTPCIHLPQTHRIIQLIRTVFDEAAPHVGLITETNVPHAENISYFGNGHNEAQLVYNFALPPLVLHSIRTGNVRILSEWAAGLSVPSGKVTFFNFLASHDGIGVNPVRGILSQAQLDALVHGVEAHQGFISSKNMPDGSQAPYELNINYFDALSDPQGTESLEIQVGRFMAAQSVLLSLVGVPGIYFHSLFGLRGWRDGALESGIPRRINRQKFSRQDLEARLKDSTSLQSRVYKAFVRLIQARRGNSAFHPHGTQQVIMQNEHVFSLLRISPDDEGQVLCLHNLSRELQTVNLPGEGPARMDLITGKMVAGGSLQLDPYQVLWLKDIRR